jgi:uncharacterized surface protein with fasciclin (FAS1) repeats
MTAAKLLRRVAAASIAVATASLAFATAGTSATTVSPDAASSAGECTLYDPATMSGLAVADAASEVDELATFSAAVAASSLADQLAAEGPFTIFAPSNEAFTRIPTNVFDSILADTELLDSILAAHVIVGEALAPDQLAAAGSVDSLNGPLTVAMEGDELVLNGGEANVTCAQIVTGNAVVYVIDQVIQPAADEMCPGDSSVPGTSTPDGSVPMASVPDSSVPDASVPGSSVPC